MFGMLSVFADFEREMIKSRIKAGLARSTKKAGRPALPPIMIEKIEKTLNSGLSINATAKRLKVGVGTVHRIKVKMANAA
jgi:DNA invertase Pin-like site-specific DNA recombinase